MNMENAKQEQNKENNINNKLSEISLQKEYEEKINQINLEKDILNQKNEELKKENLKLKVLFLFHYFFS